MATARIALTFQNRQPRERTAIIATGLPAPGECLTPPAPVAGNEPSRP